MRGKMFTPETVTEKSYEERVNWYTYRKFVVVAVTKIKNGTLKIIEKCS